MISLLRNPSPFFKSTPSLLSLPPSHHTNHNRFGKLFRRRSKGTSPEPLDDWEVLERTASPLAPQNTPRRLPPPDNDRTDNTGAIQMLQTPGSTVQRTFPPFVSRPVHRQMISGRSGKMSAPAPPVSVSSVSAFRSSLATLPDTINANDDVRHVSRDWEPQRDVPSMTPHDASSTRTYGAPPLHATRYEHGPERPVALGAQPGVDLGVVLEELSKRASRYCINLNKLVYRDKTFIARHGSSALVYRGTLRPGGSKVAIKTFRLGPSNDTVPALKVRPSIITEYLPMKHFVK